MVILSFVAGFDQVATIDIFGLPDPTSRSTIHGLFAAI